MMSAVGLAFGQQNQDFSKVEIHVLPVQGNIYMLVGAGGNITVQAGSDGVFLVDTMYAPLADKVVAAIRTISKGPIRYIVDTHVHGDHTGGNELLRKAGSTITGGNVSADIRDSAEGAQIIAHQNILNRMSATKGPDTAPSAAWPTDTYLGDEKDIFFNGEGIQVIHIPAAHTDGDSIVFFRRSDVISTGDLFTTTNYPVIDLDRGGSIQGFIAGLQKIVDMIIPVYGQEGGTMVVPGHGRLCDLGDVIEYQRDGDYHSRPDSGYGPQGFDAGTGEGREADSGLRPALWVDDRLLDDGQVRRSGL